MYVVDGICSIKIYIHPGKFKIPTDNSFINFKELLNQKITNEHVTAYHTFEKSQKRRKVYL